MSPEQLLLLHRLLPENTEDGSINDNVFYLLYKYKETYILLSLVQQFNLKDGSYIISIMLRSDIFGNILKFDPFEII